MTLPGRDSVAFLNVNVSDDASMVKAIWQKRGYQCLQTIATGPNATALKTGLGVEELPSVILLDRGGFVIGRDLRGERLKSLVEQAFGL